MSRFIPSISILFCLFSLCWASSCSQEPQDQPAVKSTYSKTEQAAYEAAKEAAQHAAEVAKELKIAMVAYHLAERTAQLAPAAAVPEEDYKAARRVWEQARDTVSSIKEAKEKAVLADPAYKTARAVQKKASETHTYNIKYRIRGYKAKKDYETLDKARKKTRQARKFVEDKFRAELTQAEKKKSAASKDRGVARKKVIETKARAQKAQRILQQHTKKVKAAEARLERAVQDVYMAAALGAFQHVADEAIAKTQSESVAQR